MENRKNLETAQNLNKTPKIKTPTNELYSENSLESVKHNQEEANRYKQGIDISNLTRNISYIEKQYKEYMLLLDELNYKKYSLEYYLDTQSKIQLYINQIIEDLEHLKKAKHITSQQDHIKKLNQIKLDYIELYQKYERIVNYRKIYEFENKIESIVKIQNEGFERLNESLSNIQDNMQSSFENIEQKHSNKFDILNQSISKLDIQNNDISTNLIHVKNKYLNQIKQIESEYDKNAPMECKNSLIEIEKIISKQAINMEDIKALLNIQEESKNCVDSAQSSELIKNFLNERLSIGESKINTQIKKSEKNISYDIFDAIVNICRCSSMQLKFKTKKLYFKRKRCMKALKIFFIIFLIAFIGAFLSDIFFGNSEDINTLNLETNKTSKNILDINNTLTKFLSNQSKIYKQEANTVIYFDSGKANMNSKDKTMLIQFIKKNPHPSKIILIGYATYTPLHKLGKYASNKELAQARAQNIKIFLLNNHIQAENIDISYDVIEDNDKVENQKVEILFYKKGD